ncbi:Glycosyltransferase, catalytic subunit of cellulose synthase and poly-beta-1,6-N-acetylglucosamine synthase [Pseudomonas cuatrocienegasensis]|uniref:Glycosyltransferase, catalytic subunit of cellulose synthase and poly-beta-1,6-N-acetylglucosamine synthase n=1 Tax=Pseudomonas cuatrocienegasensis TaxID=543360 RepID=A0ABY1BJ85_9PSED|nr:MULTISPECIES: glycosyltransferase family 2 protein [Pseudomonas]OEC35031.1 glycosyl transferase [Pseudomonas sp. 21C1]SEQ99185.1 Glycosyltransferase, catalytic subunit of cellulose synthase and poly-beta-1,6-N-acetylglucosamine synthase [Pseudomonas cuatrocienegasensis]
MMVFLNWLLSALLIVIFLPVLVLFLQVVLAYLPARSKPSSPLLRPRVAVLVPAHNESSVITATLNSLLPQLREGDRLLVVADNCTDDTAVLVRAAGAEVAERSNEQQRGKGYALDFGVRYLAADAPEVLIIVDADCQVREGSIDCLASRCIQSGRPTQALYLMHAPQGSGLKVRIAEFAWCVKNLLRPTGWVRLGWPCQLMGSGMAFVWRDLALIDLASGHIVEDLKMGLDFCRNGKPPLFCPDANVSSYFPRSEEGLSSQRTRWEHGHLGVILSDAPKLLVESLGRRNWKLLGMTLDLLVPPLALLTLVAVALFVLAWLLFGLSGLLAPAMIATVGVAMLGSTILLAWSRCGREIISFMSLLYAPFYAAKKIPLYLGFLLKRQVDWVRSKRDEH